jgi:hypothetical protein
MLVIGCFEYNSGRSRDSVVVFYFIFHISRSHYCLKPWSLCMLCFMDMDVGGSLFLSTNHFPALSYMSAYFRRDIHRSLVFTWCMLNLRVVNMNMNESMGAYHITPDIIIFIYNCNIVG